MADRAVVLFDFDFREWFCLDCQCDGTAMTTSSVDFGTLNLSSRKLAGERWDTVRSPKFGFAIESCNSYLIELKYNQTSLFETRTYFSTSRENGLISTSVRT